MMVHDISAFSSRFIMLHVFHHVSSLFSTLHQLLFFINGYKLLIFHNLTFFHTAYVSSRFITCHRFFILFCFCNSIPSSLTFCIVSSYFIISSPCSTITSCSMMFHCFYLLTVCVRNMLHDHHRFCHVPYLFTASTSSCFSPFLMFPFVFIMPSFCKPHLNRSIAESCRVWCIGIEFPNCNMLSLFFGFANLFVFDPVH